MLKWLGTGAPGDGCKARACRPIGADVDLEVRESGKVCTLKLKGRLVRSESVDKFESACRSAIVSGQIYLVLDLGGLAYLDSPGIGSIIGALRMSSSAGGTTKLVNPSNFVAKTFKTCGILGLFAIYGTEAEAVASCG
jgi:anti-anti-sigma factor